MGADADLKTRSLGMVKAPESFADDLEVSKLYQGFSAEILRLSLLGVTAISAIVMFTIRESGAPDKIDNSSRNLILLSGLSFGISAAAALTHRYVSSDSIACQLVVVRAETRNGTLDEIIKKENISARNAMFQYAKRALWVSTASLALGALILILAMSAVMRAKT